MHRHQYHGSVIFGFPDIGERIMSSNVSRPTNLHLYGSVIS